MTEEDDYYLGRLLINAQIAAPALPRSLIVEPCYALAREGLHQHQIRKLPPTFASRWCTVQAKPLGGNHFAMASASMKAR